MPAAELIFVRMSMTGICTYAAMRVMGIEHPFLGPPGVRLLLAMRGVVGFGGIGSLYYSLAYLPLGDATSITFLGPCAAAILSRIFLGETFTLIEAGAAGLSLLGVILVAKPPALFGPGASADAPMRNGVPVTEAERVTAVMIALVGVCFAGGAYTCIRAIGKRVRCARRSRADPQAHALHSLLYFSVWCCITTGVVSRTWRAELTHAVHRFRAVVQSDRRAEGGHLLALPGRHWPPRLRRTGAAHAGSPCVDVDVREADMAAELEKAGRASLMVYLQVRCQLG